MNMNCDASYVEQTKNKIKRTP